ncbi:hypothetical protein BDR26DRAFT_934375 [Obelidium mucronatum]|nr:hypothetical protein BDR26DRAFT_934375 [Obelidium mucronatum]
MGYTHSCVKPEDATCAVPPMGSCQNVPLDAVICNTNTTYYPCFRHAVSPILQNCPDKHECKPEPGMPYSLGCIGPKEISTAATIGISFATVAFIVGVGALIIIAWRCQFAITWIKKRAKREDRGVAGVEDESSGAIRLLDFMIVKED